MSRQSDLTGTTDDILQKLNQTGVEWNEQLLAHLYWDAKVMQSIQGYIQNVIYKRLVESSKNGVVLNFVSTSGGLTLVGPASQNATFMSLRDVRKANYFKRALYSTNEYMYTAPYHNGPRRNTSAIPDITVMRAVTIPGKSQAANYKPAVIGVTLKHKKILDFLLKDTIIMSATRVGDKILNCNDTDKLVCYLLDDGGYIISINQEDQYLDIGRFLGQVDPSVMDKLVNESVYDSHKNLDYQAICHEAEEAVSAGFTNFRIPSVNLFFDAMSLSWWTSKLSWAYLNFNIYNWLFSSEEKYVYAQSTSDDGHNCIKVTYEYFYGTKTKLSDEVRCQNCTRMLHAVKLNKESNMLLVVADPPCDECNPPAVPQEPVEISEEDEEEVICERTPRYRRRPTDCYDRDPREDETECGAMSLYLPSRMQILTSCIAMTTVVWLLTGQR